MSSLVWYRSFFVFFFNDTATTEIYTLSLHDALPISAWASSAEHVAHPDSAGCLARPASAPLTSASSPGAGPPARRHWRFGALVCFAIATLALPALVAWGDACGRLLRACGDAGSRGATGG